MPSTTSWPGSEPADPGGPGEPAGLLRLALRLGHRFFDPALLHQAVAHRSWCGEREGAQSNERLEFLGDAVLGAVVAEDTYHRFPDMAEGQLAKLRSAVVNTHVLAEVAQELELGDVLLLGKGEESTGGRRKESILADTVEAVIGAAHLDGGWEVSRPLVLSLLGDRINRAADAPDDYDHKSRLQELTVRSGDGTPRYVLHGSGPDHQRQFVAEVYVAGQRRGVGAGSSKKAAEQRAAEAACRELSDA